MSGFRYPNITGLSEKEQLRQLKSYLYQLVEQLNNTLPVAAAAKQVSTQAAAAQADTAAADFGALKALIIKSADIVEAYSEKIEKRLEGQYVSASEFGSFAEKTTGQLLADSSKMEQRYHSLQQLVTGLESRLLETEGYIRTGVLYYAEEDDPLPTGAPVYGMEVGQQTGDGSFQRFSRFTAHSMCFFDAQGETFASITEGLLTIRNVVIRQSFTLGGFADQAMPDGSLVTRWKGM